MTVHYPQRDRGPCGTRIDSCGTGMRYSFKAVWFDSFILPKTLERDLRYTNYRETVLKLDSFREPPV